VGRTPAAKPTNAVGPVRAVYNDETGETTWERVGQGEHQQVGAPPKAPIVKAPRILTGNDKLQINKAIGEQLAELGVDAADLDPAARNAIVKQAEEEFKTGGATGHLSAVSNAVNKVAPDGFELTGNWGSRKQTPKGGIRTVEKPVPGAGGPGAPKSPKPAAPAQAAPAAAPAPTAAPKAEHGARPAGATDAQILAQANASISSGKDPAVIKARLKAWGVQFKE
jgi:hypothetical protein